MSVVNSALNAYGRIMDMGLEKTKDVASGGEQEVSFTQTLEDSLAQVNELQLEKSRMIKEFAAGENQNVHELMIALQKADLAMKVTTAVRSKVMEAYKQIMNMPI